MIYIRYIYLIPLCLYVSFCVCECNVCIYQGRWSEELSRCPYFYRHFVYGSLSVSWWCCFSYRELHRRWQWYRVAHRCVLVSHYPMFSECVVGWPSRLVYLWDRPGQPSAGPSWCRTVFGRHLFFSVYHLWCGPYERHHGAVRWLSGKDMYRYTYIYHMFLCLMCLIYTYSILFWWMALNWFIIIYIYIYI